MKKKRERYFPYLGNMKNQFRKMKLTLILTLLVFVTFGNGFSQKLSLNFKKATIQEVIQTMEDQTDYIFLYKDEIFDQEKRYSVDFNEESFDEVLALVCKSAEVEYEIRNERQIILKERSKEKLILIQQENKSISGIVTGTDGLPIPGVSVMVTGTAVGTTTNMDGEFQLEIPAVSETLLFSFVGMKKQEVSVVGKTIFTIILESENIGIDEIVAIGYGTQKKKDITGAVGTVQSENFNKGVASSPGQLIQGKVSGVNVTSSSGAPGSGQRITIRGQGTIRQGSGPLFVIDGFPIGLAGTGSGSSPLNFLNPEDIETMDVLKDASATAIYGSRGANGVILITTKKGKSGVSKVTISSNVGISTIAKKLPVFGADEFRKQVVAVGGSLNDWGSSTNWQDELTRTAITQDHNLIMSGGTDKLTYRASLGYLDQEGIVINTGIKRYSGRVSATQKLMDGRLNIDFNLNSTIEIGDNAHMGTVVSSMLSTNPTYPAYDSNGSIAILQDRINPLSQAELFMDFKESRKMIVNIAPSFEIIDGLVYKLNLGYENRSSDLDKQEMPSVDPYVEGKLEQQFFNGTNTLIENYLTYTVDFDDHNVTLLGGYSYQKTDERYRKWKVEKFEPNGIEPRMNPLYGQRIEIGEDWANGWARINELQSYFGRATYSYQGKYMLTGTVRVDGSSKFGENNRYGTFPSFAAGWRISEESFMQSSPFSNLKLRAGWGQTGNQEIPAKITKESYTSKNSGDYTYPLSESGSYPVGTDFVRFANPDIQWEVSTQTNVGLDFGLFDGALSGTIDYFHKTSTNILVEVPAFDPVSPAPTYWTNVDEMKIINKGLEIALDYQYRNQNGFSYSVGANATFIDNVVEDSPFTVLTTGSASGSGQTGATINGMINGYPIGSFHMLKFTGIGADGLSTYEGGDKNPMVVGSALPEVMYNFYANMNYKKFDLSFNFNGVSGNELYNHTAMNKFYKGQLATSNNTTADAIEFSEEAITNAALVSTRYLEDGSFFRLNNMTLGYTFDTNSMGIGSWAKDLRLSFTGQNLFIITDYSGFDPEVNQDKSSGGVQSFGIDDNGYPKSRTFVVGLNVTF